MIMVILNSYEIEAVRLLPFCNSFCGHSYTVISKFRIITLYSSWKQVSRIRGLSDHLINDRPYSEITSQYPAKWF